MPVTGSEPIGEVIQTSTAEIAGECRRGQEGPAFGSLIVAGKAPACLAVVYNVETASPDSYRRPGALHMDEDEIPKKYPQLSLLLKKQFHALLIGEWNGGLVYGLPRRPPALHAGVAICDEEMLRGAGAKLGFLRLLYDAGKPASEELLLCVCKTLLEAHGWRREEAVRIGKALSDLYRDDYETLRRITGRLEAWLS